MKYYFIMNPVAGSSHQREKFLASLNESTIDFELIFTTRQGDGALYAADIFDSVSSKAVPARIFACGGDGTLHEVVNGVLSAAGRQASETPPGKETGGAAGPAGSGSGASGLIEIGSFPLGTGNDFIRNFGIRSEFLDLDAARHARSVWCDAIRYTARRGEELTAGYCVNMINIGLDCRIVDTTSSIKSVPGVNGSMAYLLSVLVNLIRKEGEDIRVEYPDGYLHDGRLLLISIANGCFCGGGIKGLPLARTDDGLMDVSLVRNVSRREFLRLFPSYAKGTHLDSALLKRRDMLRYTQETGLTIAGGSSSSGPGEFKFCVDGEITLQQSVQMEIVPRAFRFLVPARR